MNPLDSSNRAEYFTNINDEAEVNDLVLAPLKRIAESYISSKKQNSDEKSSRSVCANSLRSTLKGQNGPTFLVNLPRNLLNLDKYVIKWTKQPEFIGNLLCISLLDSIKKIEPLFQLKAPRSSLISMNHSKYTDPLLNEVTFSPELSDSLNKVLSEIKSAAPANYPPNNNDVVMISDLVSGCTLYDFFKNNLHTEFGEDRELERSFYFQLGQVMILDLIMGQTDRLLKPNFGNLMIQLDEDEKGLRKITVHLIDNDINASGKVPLFDRTEGLGHEIQNGKRNDDIEHYVQELLEKIDTTLINISRDNSGSNNPEKISRALSNHIKDGVSSMISSLNSVKDEWEQSDSIKRLDELDPGIKQFLQKRFKHFFNEKPLGQKEVKPYIPPHLRVKKESIAYTQTT